MERSVTALNESIGLSVAARNNSSSSVNKLTIQLQQECKWSANGHPAKKDRTLASEVVLPGSEVGGLQWTPGTGNENGQIVTPIEDNPHSDLQQQLASWAGTRFELVVPGNSLPTLQAENVAVSHSVGVVLDTPCCIAEPSVWTPLCVVPMIMGPKAQQGATSIVPPQALPNFPPQTEEYPAGPYGSSQTVPYLSCNPPPSTAYDGPAQTEPYPSNISPPCVGYGGSAQTVPYSDNNPPPGMTYGGSAQMKAPPYRNNDPPPGMTYGSAQTVPYPNNYPPPGITYGAAEPGVARGVQHPFQQAMPYVEMDADGHAKPGYVPQTGG